MRCFRLLLLLAAAPAAAATPAAAAAVATIVAHHGSVYQTDKPGEVTEGFLEIENTGPADTLVAANCPIADTTQIIGPDGKPLASVAIPALQNVTLSAKGPHLLLQGTHFSVQYGSIIPCSVTFSNAGTLSIFLYATPKP
jgi:copper(I)-binding protein